MENTQKNTQENTQERVLAYTLATPMEQQAFDAVSGGAQGTEKPSGVTVTGDIFRPDIIVDN